MSTPHPCYDSNRRTCIAFSREDGVVRYVPLDIEEGFEVRQEAEEDFDQRFKPMVEYPVVKAAELYIGYAKSVGASKEALDLLGSIKPLSKEDIEMATKQKAARAATVKKTGTAKPKATATKAKAKAAPKERKPRGESAASMFKELIMRGTMTDDQIFKKVQEKHGLDDSKRSYVAWYRNSLRKAGEKVPDPK